MLIGGLQKDFPEEFVVFDPWDPGSLIWNREYSEIVHI